MDWKQVVADLKASGLKQQEIAKQCGVAQSTISDIGRGVTTSPAHDIGEKLLTLHKRRQRLRAKAAA